MNTHLWVLTEIRNKGKINELVNGFLRGMAMGAADVVPGVSGGTIAL